MGADKMKRQKLTRWTPELRAKLFNFRRTPTWEIKIIIKETEERLKAERTHGPAGNLEQVNFYRNKINAAQTEIRKRGSK